MAFLFAILLYHITVSSVLCRPSDFANQDLNDWEDFTQQNDFANAERDAWKDISNDIGNDINHGRRDEFDLQNKRKAADSQLIPTIDKNDPSQDIEETNSNETEIALEDPCYGVRCRAGKMCMVVDSSTNATQCVCPTSCPTDDAPICTTLGKQYNSTCLAHKEHCQREEEFEIAYSEACIAKQGPCLPSELSQFPIRFLDWMMHIRQAEILGETDPNSSVQRMSDVERFSVSKWMFERVDLEHDQSLQPYDMKMLLRQLLPVEHCIDEFLLECDADKSSEVSMTEWNNCLMPGTNSVENDFFDQL